MSQRVVETILGRLVTDEDFRRHFAEQPHGACRQVGSLTEDELGALAGIDTGSLRAIHPHG